MSKNNFLLLVVWNVALTGLLAWALLGKSAKPLSDRTTDAVDAADSAAVEVGMTTDTAALKDAHIAFFFMDSIQSGYELVKESASRVQSMGRQLEGTLSKELQRAQNRAQELASKDHTYSTQAELEADEKEFRDLERRIAELRANSQGQIDEMQIQLLQEITIGIQEYLAEYNKEHGFDFIFSIQDEGQIWVGNKGLDITADVINGLNAKHREKKAAATPKGK
jgi:outer membrane protein